MVIQILKEYIHSLKGSHLALFILLGAFYHITVRENFWTDRDHTLMIFSTTMMVGVVAVSLIFGRKYEFNGVPVICSMSSLKSRGAEQYLIARSIISSLFTWTVLSAFMILYSFVRTGAAVNVQKTGPYIAADLIAFFFGILVWRMLITYCCYIYGNERRKNFFVIIAGIAVLLVLIFVMAGFDQSIADSVENKRLKSEASLPSAMFVLYSL